MRIFDQLAEQLQRPTLGLDLSLRMGPELVGAVGYAFLHSATLDAAIDAFANAVFSIQGVTALQYARDPEPTVRYVIWDDRLHPRRQDVEFSLGYVNALIRRFLARPYAPREVHVEHAPNGPRAQYDAIFGCPTYFEQPQNALILREVDIDEAGRLHDPHLVAILQHYMELARPGGAVVVLDYARHDDERMREQADLWLGFSESELKKLARSSGLHDAKISAIPPRLTGHGPDAHLPWQLMIGRKEK